LCHFSIGERPGAGLALFFTTLLGSNSLSGLTCALSIDIAHGFFFGSATLGIDPFGPGPRGSCTLVFFFAMSNLLCFILL